MAVSVTTVERGIEIPLVPQPVRAPTPVIVRRRSLTTSNLRGHFGGTSRRTN